MRVTACAEGAIQIINAVLAVSDTYCDGFKVLATALRTPSHRTARGGRIRRGGGEGLTSARGNGDMRRVAGVSRSPAGPTPPAMPSATPQGCSPWAARPGTGHGRCGDGRSLRGGDLAQNLFDAGNRAATAIAPRRPRDRLAQRGLIVYIYIFNFSLNYWNLANSSQNVDVTIFI